MTSGGQPWIGADNPTLTITEFSDYQCPYCKRGYEEMRKLIQTYPSKVRLVHRHFPLDDSCNLELTRPFHPFACIYARMAVCAQKHGRFWEASDFLFNNGRQRDLIMVAELAKAIKVRKSSLDICLEETRTAEVIKEDLNAGRALRIHGTPTFVIGERTYPGQIPAEVLEGVLSHK